MTALRQRNVPWLGKIVDSLYTSLPLLSIINFLSIVTVLYTTTKEYLVTIVPWINLGWFLLGLVVITLGTMAAIYLFVLPSLWTWRSKMMYGFDSDLMKNVKELSETVQKLERRLGEKSGKNTEGEDHESI